jgi:pilus assembly protein CpaB
MNSRKTILLLAAGLIGIVTIFVVRGMLSSAPPPPPVIPTSEILAAAHDMPTGTILREMDTKWIPWSADAIQSGNFYVKDKMDPKEVIGGVLRQAVHADEPLLPGYVVKTGDHGFLAAVLAPGKEAMSVTLTPNAGVAGFVFPGDHVDVILTHMFSRKNISDMTERYVSETVLTDVRVLALDQKSDDQSNDPKVAQLATLEVTPKQAEKLALAAGLVGQNSANHATLSLALRSLATDPETDAKNATTTWDSEVSSAFPTVNGNDGLIQKVQVMRGSKEAVEGDFERQHRP